LFVYCYNGIDVPIKPLFAQSCLIIFKFFLIYV